MDRESSAHIYEFKRWRAAGGDADIRRKRKSVRHIHHFRQLRGIWNRVRDNPLVGTPSKPRRTPARLALVWCAPLTFVLDRSGLTSPSTARCCFAMFPEPKTNLRS